jgi:DNA-binding response OmpR family regulator
VGTDAGVYAHGPILLVDDDRDLVDLLAFLVEQAGLTPVVALDPTVALDLFEKESPLVAVVDLNLRPGDGFELVAELRRRSAALPIIVLTARASEDDKVRALDLGADDYIVKPFGHRELVARVRAHVRRAQVDKDGVTPPPILEVGQFRLDPSERTLELHGEVLHLTATEFKLMQYLMKNSDAVVPTAALARHVWGYDDAGTRDVVRVTVHRLRRKIGDDGPRRLIHTVPGIGLKLRSVREDETERTL